MNSNAPRKIVKAFVLALVLSLFSFESRGADLKTPPPAAEGNLLAEQFTAQTQTRLPLEFRVIDKHTRKPVTEFSYAYRILASESREQRLDPAAHPWHEFDSRDSPHSRPEKWEKAVSPDGVFRIEAPPACEISVWIEAPGFVSEPYKTWEKYVVRSGDAERKLIFELERGVTVKGTIRDAKTNLPVAGARVCPLVFGGTIDYEDLDRAITTGEDGRYELSGVDSGISVTHPDYLEYEIHSWTLNPSEAQGVVIPWDVPLETGETFRGVVRDAEGKPLAGVTVDDGSGKSVESDQDGAFVLKSPRKWEDNGKAYYFIFVKEGYIRKTIKPTEIAPEGLAVILETPVRLEGRVISSGGKPVPEFTVVAGPGKQPEDYHCSQTDVKSAEGCFSLGLKTTGEYWMGIRAPGQAAFEDWVTVRRGMEPVTFKLSEGVRVMGKIEAPVESYRGTRARLVPQRIDDHGDPDLPARVVATMEAPVSEAGSFVFQHVRSDKYTLEISGEKITPISPAVVVAGEDVDLGILNLRGTGRIVGRVFKPESWGGGAWSFAQGFIDLPDDVWRRKSIAFTADERGGFAVEGVPAGTVIVRIPFHASTDLVFSFNRTAEVIEGETTEVNFHEPSASGKVTFEFKIGDGSKGHFLSGTGMGAKRLVENVTTRAPRLYIKLEPSADASVSYPSADWEEMSEGRIILDDVSPGKYHLWVGDWLGSMGFEGGLYEADVEIHPGVGPVSIPLAAGCITGKIEWEKKYRRLIRVVALPDESALALREGRCDEDGNFCLRYLPAGTYAIYAHDHQAGWCRVNSIAVNNQIVDVGSYKLQPGGAVAGKIALGPGQNRPDELTIKDARGTIIASPDFKGSGDEEYQFNNLWPGVWTVELKSGNEVLASRTLEIEGTETARCDLPGE